MSTTAVSTFTSYTNSLTASTISLGGSSTPTTCASGISNARITELSRTSTAIRVYFAYDGDSSCGTPDDVDLNAWVNDGSFSDTQVITARRISSFSTDSSGRYLSVPIADLDGEGLDWDVYF